MNIHPRFHQPVGSREASDASPHNGHWSVNSGTGIRSGRRATRKHVCRADRRTEFEKLPPGQVTGLTQHFGEGTEKGYATVIHAMVCLTKFLLEISYCKQRSRMKESDKGCTWRVEIRKLDAMRLSMAKLGRSHVA